MDNCRRGSSASTGATLDKGNLEPLIVDFSRLKVFCRGRDGKRATERDSESERNSERETKPR